MTYDQTTDRRPHHPVPESVRFIVDRAAGRMHSTDGPVMRCAADVVAEVHRLDADYLEAVAALYGHHASPDYIAGFLAAARSLREQDTAPLRASA
jgi:hypothetical protein